MNRSSVNGELSLFSYEILGLVGRGGAGPHDLLRMARHGRMLDWAGESQYYVEPKRLAKLGYLDARKEPGRTRERTVYTLTDKGLDALRAWANTPVEFTPLKSELLLRLLIADLVGEEATRKGIAALRDDIADLLDRLQHSETNAETLPHRRKYLLLVTSFLRRLLALHLDLVDQVERELAPRTRSTPVLSKQTVADTAKTRKTRH
jgi:PadR family transcriptional regulator, regulatory protein AphA